VLDLQNQSKLVEAISFFVGHTKHCGLTKLFKLLYWLDYHHFRETGETVTGLTYQALPRGPVPSALYEELKAGAGKTANHFRITKHTRVTIGAESLERTIDDDDDRFAIRERQVFAFARSYNQPSKIVPLARYQHKYLTRREQRIASHLAEIFNECTAEQISDVSHARGGPWKQALKDRGERADIDFLGKLFPVTNGNYLDEEELRRRAAEYEETVKHFA
jgi:uncharacterized phage-associated protein